MLEQDGEPFAMIEGASFRLRVEVQDPEGSFVYPLSEDRVIEARGPLGLTAFLKFASAADLTCGCNTPMLGTVCYRSVTLWSRTLVTGQ